VFEDGCEGGLVHVWIPAIVAGAASAATIACGSQSESQPAALVPTIPPVQAPVVAAARSPALPPNADGDPPCPAADAWGRDPFRAGILVTHWSDDTAPVTVLVRTRAGTDQAQRALLNPGELRLFEFPGIEPAAVSEVLIMTNTRRCYVTADPAALG
jgi:hypothetical protein